MYNHSHKNTTGVFWDTVQDSFETPKALDT